MADIFDQISPESSPSPAVAQPDIFDHVAAQVPQRQPDIFDHVEAATQAPDWKTRANAHIATLGLNPSNPTDAGQMYGVYDAYRKQFGTPQEQAQPTRVQQMEGERQAQVQAQNQQRGVVSSNVIEALHPAGELFARGERLLAPIVGAVSPEAAQNMQASARSLEETRGADGISSMPGQLAGSLVTYANPLVAAVSGGNAAYVQDERAKAAGAQIGTGGEIAHVVGKAALDAVVSRVFSGGTPGKSVSSEAEKAVARFIAQKAPEYIAKYGAKAAVGVLVNDAGTIGENALVQRTVDPNRGLTDHLLESTLMGAAIPVAHEAISSRFSRAQTGEAPRPADEIAKPSETPVTPTTPARTREGTAEAVRKTPQDFMYHGVRDVDDAASASRDGLAIGGLTHDIHEAMSYAGPEGFVHVFDKNQLPAGLRTRAEHIYTDENTRREISDSGQTPDTATTPSAPLKPTHTYKTSELRQPAPAAEAPKSTHPPELADAKQVGEWYGKTFNDSANAQTIEALASMHPGKYKLIDVPVDKIDPNVMMGSDTTRSKVDAIKGLSPEERAKLPPVIAVGEGDKLMIADGTHRLTAAKEAGEKTIKAYVPESFAGDPSQLKRFVAGEPVAEAKPVTTAITDHGKKISFTDEAGQTTKGKYLSTTMEKGFHWVEDEHGVTHRVPDTAITLRDRKLPSIKNSTEMSFTEYKEAAKAAGYTKLDNIKDRATLNKAVSRQRAESFTDLARPPKDMSNGRMGLKGLRYWAEQNGYTLEGVTNLRDARETVRQQYAHSIREGRKQGSTQNIDEIGANVPIVKTAVSKAMQNPEVKQAMRETPRRNAVVRGFEYLATPLDSQVKDISPRVYGKMQRSLEIEPRANAGRIVRDLVEPRQQMTEALGGKGSEKYEEFRLALRNQDFATARKLIGPENEAGFNKFLSGFAEARKHATENGVQVPYLENYWSSHVKDYESFRKEYGKDQGQFEDAWDLAEARQGGKPLTDEQRLEVANQVIQGFGPRKPGVGGPGNAKTRSIETITIEQLKHYIDPFESAFRYIETMERSAGRAKFLGKSDNPGAVAESVGKLLQEEIDAGKLDREGQRQLKALLTTRLNGEYLTPAKAIRTWKEVIYLTHITSLRSGLNQLTDLATTASRFGVGNTLKGIKAAIGPEDRRVLNDMLGLSANGEEFKDPGKLAKVLNLATKTNLFQKIDRFTKDVHAGAAWESFQKAAKNPESESFRRFERDYKEALGTETWDKAVADAREGKRTAESGIVPAMALMEVQPLTLNQMPPAYLRMQNGRIVYALKTFTASAFNNMRRQTFAKLATPGQRREGLANLAKMLVLVGGAGFGKELIGDMIKGKDIDADSIKDDAENSLLNMIALSRYAVGKAADKPSDVVSGFFLPTIPLADEAVHDTLHSTDKKGEFKGLALAANLPIVGDVSYYWTPLGRGWYLNETEAKKEWNTKLAALKKEADAAGVEGDTAAQAMLMAVYNEKSKSGPNPTLTQTVTGRQPEFKSKSNLTAGSLIQARQRQVMAAKKKALETKRKESVR